MQEELVALLDVALDREIVSQSFYLAGQKKTQDVGAIRLMQEMYQAEEKHYAWLMEFKAQGARLKVESPGVMHDLMISETLVDTGIPSQAGLQDVIVAAMKREENSVDFYSKMKQAMDNESGKTLCDRLILEETHHKLRLEKFYDDFFNKEN
jgi:rubrerythrin